MGTVYLLGDADKPDCYKIGATRYSVEKRVKSLQTGNGGEIFVVSEFNTKNPFIIERFLHKKFQSSKILNEWFNLSIDEVKNFEDECQHIENLINSLDDNVFFSKN